jgi:hypothetical protein
MNGQSKAIKDDITKHLDSFGIKLSEQEYQKQIKKND